MLEPQIHAELKAWIDPLSPEEYAQLEANLLAEGCRDAIVVWEGFILDGHNRYEICSRHDVAFTTVEKAGLATWEDALVWMAQNQLGRRNLSDFTRAALALQLKPLIKKRAQQRMLAGRVAASDPTQKSAEGSGETREVIAKAAGVSRDTVRKVEKILESGNAEVTAQVRAGEISINAAAKKVAPTRASATDAAVAPLSASPAAAHAAAPAPALAAPVIVVSAASKPADVAPAQALGPEVEERDISDRLLADLYKVASERDRLKKRNDELEALLEQNDLAAQVDHWKASFEGISGRNAGLIKKLNELEPEAVYQRETLQQIRQILGVERTSDIVPALRARRAA
jgi:hypothetical protein